MESLGDLRRYAPIESTRPSGESPGPAFCLACTACQEGEAREVWDPCDVLWARFGQSVSCLLLLLKLFAVWIRRSRDSSNGLERALEGGLQFANQPPRTSISSKTIRYCPSTEPPRSGLRSPGCDGPLHGARIEPKGHGRHRLQMHGYYGRELSGIRLRDDLGLKRDAP